MTIQEQKDLISNSTFKNHIFFDSNDSYLEVCEFNQSQFITFENFYNLFSFIRKSVSPDIRIRVKSVIEFDNKEVDEELNLSHCDFEKKVIFSNCTFNMNVDFRNCNFYVETSFKKSEFISKCRFHFSNFETPINFENTTFNNLVDFYHSDFKETQSFFLTDFLNISIFSNVTFHRQVQFLYNKVGEKTFISFENATFKKSLDISRSNFWCRLQVWGVITPVIPEEQWLYETDNINQTAISTNLVALKRIRESYRIIKQELRGEGNNIEALKYHEYEMEVYSKELKSRTETRKTGDLIILWFNKWSNNFGTSWSRALAFTLITTFIFYSIFLLSISDELIFAFSLESIGNTIKYFIQFLNVTSWDFKPFGISDFIWGYVILYIGRLFIGFGYYQTIQAFRKYGKN
ncbi:pentapeptide repeat-containing protein [Cyclobacterium roseum]|uniref:pentapeptide repeat-containing protein n=1 Tax=Cyclobacterium roseum TaxID=2666137 RepID=UPI001391A128|nr:pentapeptide repeat-containing protein [Cyclobacterium roseum]